MTTESGQSEEGIQLVLAPEFRDDVDYLIGNALRIRDYLADADRKGARDIYIASLRTFYELELRVPQPIHTMDRTNKETIAEMKRYLNEADTVLRTLSRKLKEDEDESR